MEPTVLDIHDAVQFLVDDTPIAASRGLVRRLNPLRKVQTGPVLAAGPEEGSFCSPVAVLRDGPGGEWRLWYNNYGLRGSAVVGETTRLAYSVDGIRWEKRPLDACAVDGNRNNNVVAFPDKPVVGACAVLVDPADGDPARRYKMIYYLPNYYLAYSADGIRWQPARKDPVWPNGSGDGLEETYFFFNDPLAGLYRGYMRVWRRHQTIRKVALGESQDLTRWSGPQIIWEAVPEWGIGAQIYGMNVWTDGGLYWGLPWVFYGDEPLDPDQRQTLRLKLAWSRDGYQWHALFPEQDAMPMGATGAFDAGMILSSCPMVELPDRLRFYYYGSDGRHDGSAQRSSVGLAEIRRGGFVSLRADGEGSLVTHRFLLRGEELRINARTEGDGWVGAELLNDYGSVMEGFDLNTSDRFTGDAVDHVLSWKGRNNIAFLRGQYVRLRLTLNRADLYSFRVAGRKELFLEPVGPAPVRCGRCVRAPVVDGLLSDECWMDFGNSGVADEFVRFAENAPAPVKTRVLMTYDDLHLYLAVECEEPHWQTLKPAVSGQGINYTKDEVIEFRFSAPGHGSHVHQLMVTHDGRKLHCWFSKEAGDSRALDRAEWEARTASVPGRWTIEMAVPFLSLTTDTPRAGEQWKLNIIRYRHAGGDDVSCWSCMFGSVHRNDVAGALVFG